MKLFEIFKRLFKRKKNTEIMYICVGDTLPEPLSVTDEGDCIRRMCDENCATRLEAKDELIEHNLRLVVYIAHKFENTGVDSDDLISIGTMGLIKAVNSFKADKNIKLATYASRCIENEILMCLRRAVKLRLEVSLDEPLNVDFEGNELLMSDVLGTDPDIVSRNVEESAVMGVLYDALNKLNDREKIIIEMRFGLNGRKEKTQKEVADLLGISQSYISRLEKKIISRLRKDMLKTL